MAEILLSCNEDDYDVAVELKATLQSHFDFAIELNVEKLEEDEELDAKIADATVLFLFEVGESMISAWITLYGIDMENSNYEQSPFPETIDFSDASEGLEILEDVLSTDFGLDVRPWYDHEDEQEEVKRFSWWNLSEEPKSEFVAVVRSY